MAVDKISGVTNNIHIPEAAKTPNKIVLDVPEQEDDLPIYALTVVPLLKEADSLRVKSLLSFLYPGTSSLVSSLGPRAFTLQSFKEQGGQFVDGKAYRPGGKAYTGTIFHSTGDNGRVALTYEDGFLNKVDKFDENSSLVSEKTYSYDKEGKLTNISTVFADGTTSEMSKNKKGIILRKNDKIVKAFYSDARKNLQRVSNFDDSGRIVLTTCTGPGADYPLKKFYYFDGSKATKRVECYTEDGRLRKLVLNEDNGSSKTILCPNQKNEQVIREVRVAEDGPLPYDADKMIINGVEKDACSIIYIKDDKEIVVEKYGANQRTEVVYGSYEKTCVRKDAGSRYRWVTIEDKRTGETKREIRYDSGARDVLIGGDFGGSDMEVEFHNSSNIVTGYFKRTYLETVAYDSNFFRSVITDRVKEEYFDSRKNLTSSNESTCSHTTRK